MALRVYGAQAVEYDFKASRQLESYERNGFGRLPVCIAKTHLSISSDPALKGAPTGWVMPGLSVNPAATRIDIDSRGEIVGLS